jgi:prepilin-type N-terminal cleavage/methylation domain-containing protein
MFIVRVNRFLGFTLLEIIMAVAILATMAIAIYRFVESNIIAIRVSSDTIAADARYDGLRDVLAHEWQSLPQSLPSGKPILLGDVFKLNERERDEISWICGPGPGLMTRYAAGDFWVTLRLQSKKGSDQLELGFLRKPKDDTSLTNANESWVPLIENVQSLKIRYFDAQLNVWQEKWPYPKLPHLVKVVVGRADSAAAWEVIIPVRRVPL